MEVRGRPARPGTMKLGEERATVLDPRPSILTPRQYPSAVDGVNWLTPPVSLPVCGLMAMAFGRAKLKVGPLSSTRIVAYSDMVACVTCNR